MAQVVFIDAERDAYSPNQIGETYTAGELAKTFKRISEDEGDNLKVFIRHDEGYTYGAVTGWVINVEECEGIDDYDYYSDGYFDEDEED